MPLIFGTLKATFYSLLFAIPIALLAAVYTSEFVHPRVRTAVKPTMEMMASLPSVVLGFIAALVLAPIVETWIASVLLALFAVPLTLLSRSRYLWQLLPQPLALRLEGLPKFALDVRGDRAWRAALLDAAAPAFERLLFGGDFRQWLDGATGSGAPLLFLLLLPLCFGGLAVAVARGFGAALRARIRDLDRSRAGALDGVLWLALLAACAAAGGRPGPRARGARPRPARRAGRHLRAAQHAGGRLRDGLRGDPDHLHDRRGRHERGAEPPARGEPRLRRDAPGRRRSRW